MENCVRHYDLERGVDVLFPGEVCACFFARHQGRESGRSRKISSSRSSSAMAQDDKASAGVVTVSGPFNVQHIPKVRNITQPASNTFTTSTPSGAARSSTPLSGMSAAGASSVAEPTAFVANAILVCTLGFYAEYNNELTCTPGDVFKLVDPKIISGWVLVQSLSSGRKGWVPKDNVKILDLHNSSGNGSILRASSEKRAEKEREREGSGKQMTPSMSSSSACVSSSSILDFYSTQLTPCSSSISSQTSSVRLSAKIPESKTDTNAASDSDANIDNDNDNDNDSANNNELTHTYASIFAHSMYFLESSSSYSYWYRIDLVSAQNSNQKIHLCRYYADILALSKYLSLQIASFKEDATLPLLPGAFSLSRSSYGDESFATHISEVDGYLQQLFNVISSQRSDSPLISTFLKFCQSADNDFEHYVPLDDDQILQILKPQSETDKEIELVLKEEEGRKQNKHGKLQKHHSKDSIHTVGNDGGNFLFTAPAPKLHKSFSSTSLSSKNSSVTTISSPSSNSSTLYVKIKIIYKDDFSLIRLPGDELTFASLSTAISDKLKGLCRFTMAYRNDRGVFILLRDDNGLRKALLVNNKKIIVKVI